MQFEEAGKTTWENLYGKLRKEQSKKYKKWSPYDNSTISPVLKRKVRNQLKYKTVTPNVKPVKPQFRYNSNSELAHIPKLSKIDTKSFKYYVGFYSNPKTATFSKADSDQRFLNNPMLYKNYGSRSTMRGMNPPTRGVFQPSFLGAMTGGAASS